MDLLDRESPEEERDLTHPEAQSAAEIREVFGESDEELADYGAQHDMEQVIFLLYNYYVV